MRIITRGQGSQGPADRGNGLVHAHVADLRKLQPPMHGHQTHSLFDHRHGRDNVDKTTVRNAQGRIVATTIIGAGRSGSD